MNATWYDPILGLWTIDRYRFPKNGRRVHHHLCWDPELDLYSFLIDDGRVGWYTAGLRLIAITR